MIRGKTKGLFLIGFVGLLLSIAGRALAAEAASGEMHLVLPDFSSVSFLGMNGRTLLSFGLLVCAAGFGFGLMIYQQLKNLPVHKSMREISELIYETCKTYLMTQGKFILLLEVFIGTIMAVYFARAFEGDIVKVVVVLFFSLVGIAGSYGVAWFGIRVNTFANSRTAFAALKGKPFPTYEIPLKAGMSIGMVLISTELSIMLLILLFVPASFAGPCFIGFAIGESLGASALRIAGGIFTKIADIGSDLMKIVFNIKEDDARNPGVIADCTGDNAGDSVGPSADGFETYGVTGVALITFILLVLKDNADLQVKLLVWIFAMRIMMIIASGLLRQRRPDELRAAVDRARVAHVGRFHRHHLHRLVPAHQRPRLRRSVVAAVDDHQLRHHRRCRHPRSGEGVHLDRLRTRARGGHRFA